MWILGVYIHMKALKATSPQQCDMVCPSINSLMSGVSNVKSIPAPSVGPIQCSNPCNGGSGGNVMSYGNTINMDSLIDNLKSFAYGSNSGIGGGEGGFIGGGGGSGSGQYIDLGSGIGGGSQQEGFQQMGSSPMIFSPQPAQMGSPPMVFSQQPAQMGSPQMVFSPQPAQMSPPQMIISQPPQPASPPPKPQLIAVPYSVTVTKKNLVVSYLPTTYTSFIQGPTVTVKLGPEIVRVTEPPRIIQSPPETVFYSVPGPAIVSTVTSVLVETVSETIVEPPTTVTYTEQAVPSIVTVSELVPISVPPVTMTVTEPPSTVYEPQYSVYVKKVTMTQQVGIPLPTPYFVTVIRLVQSKPKMYPVFVTRTVSPPAPSPARIITSSPDSKPVTVPMGVHNGFKVKLQYSPGGSNGALLFAPAPPSMPQTRGQQSAGFSNGNISFPKSAQGIRLVSGYGSGSSGGFGGVSSGGFMGASSGGFTGQSSGVCPIEVNSNNALQIDNSGSCIDHSIRNFKNLSEGGSSDCELNGLGRIQNQMIGSYSSSPCKIMDSTNESMQGGEETVYLSDMMRDNNAQGPCEEN